MVWGGRGAVLAMGRGVWLLRALCQLCCPQQCQDVGLALLWLPAEAASSALTSINLF